MKITTRHALPISAALLAVAITTAMDFSGLTMFSALPLTGLIAAAWLVQRLSAREIGLRLGRASDYALALAYPLVVLGLAAAVAFASGSISTAQADWTATGVNILLGSTVGSIMVLITEEGFFRGWLWGSFRRGGLDERGALAATTTLFVVWHISAVTSGSEYALPLWQAPIYLVNVALLGLIWGVMRWRSGSILVPAVSHAVWNAIAYGLFGFGERVGALGIADTALLGPEAGVAGVVLNGAFLWWLFRRTTRAEPVVSPRSAPAAPSPPPPAPPRPAPGS